MPVLLDVDPPQILVVLGAVATALAGIGRLFGWLAELRRQRAYKAVPSSTPALLPPPPIAAAPASAEHRIARAEWEADRARLNWRLEEARRQVLVANREVEKLQDALTSERSARARLEHLLKHSQRRAKVVEGIQDVTELALPDEEAPTWVLDPVELLKTPLRPQPLPPPSRKLVPL
jgi:hypothetical protein